MTHHHTCLFVLGMVALGCASKAPASEQPQAKVPAPAAVAPPAPDPLLVHRPRTQSELPTTNADLFLGNLASRVQAGKAAWKRTGLASDALMVVGPMASSGKLDGDLDRIGEAIEIATRALAKAPTERGLMLARADANAALHRFAPALADAKRAHALRPTDDSAAMIADLAWNLGDYDTAIRGIRKAAEKPSFSSLVRLAQLELDLGNLQAAERAYARAELTVKNVSPLPVAWLNVQRGLFYLHTGRFERAEVFYREAVARMPSYPLAVEHLAEIEALLGKRDSAVSRYRKVVEQTNNPELIGALADMLDELGDEKAARELEQRARRRFATLLASHPEAMYWHAADFHLEHGNARLARQLLAKNVELRPHAVSHAALASAELALGNLDAAEKSIERALKSPVKRAEIYFVAARVKLARGDRAEAQRFEALAKRLNPRISDLEGPLESS